VQALLYAGGRRGAFGPERYRPRSPLAIRIAIMQLSSEQTAPLADAARHGGVMVFHELLELKAAPRHS
jgi:hypothetical protein